MKKRVLFYNDPHKHFLFWMKILLKNILLKIYDLSFIYHLC